MSVLIAWLHLLTGLAYIFGVGVLSAVDVYRQYGKTRKIFWFGMGLVAMAASCGPHHLEVGYHILDGNIHPIGLDIVTILISLPFGVAWLWWRAGAITERWAGDMALKGHIGSNLSIALMVYFGLISGMVLAKINSFTFSPSVLNQVCLVVLYALFIGYFLWTGQHRRWLRDKRWSAAGLALAIIFPTCALSHLVYASAVASGVYPATGHIAIIDWAGVPFALWFSFLCMRARISRV